MAKLYANARAVIYISDREAFGLPPVEALAYGTPAIVANQPITHEIFGNNAFFVRNEFASLFKIYTAAELYQPCRYYLCPITLAHKPSLNYLKVMLEDAEIS